MGTFSSENTEARPTTLREETTLGTKSAYTIKNIKQDATKQASHIGQNRTKPDTNSFIETSIPKPNRIWPPGPGPIASRTGAQADHRHRGNHDPSPAYPGLGSKPASHAQGVPTVRTWGLGSSAGPHPGPGAGCQTLEGPPTRDPYGHRGTPGPGLSRESTDPAG